MRVTAIAEAAVAKRTASESGRPSESATASAPLKVSPAPVVSTASTLPCRHPFAALRPFDECALAAERHHHVPHAARQQRDGRPFRTGRIGYGHSREHGALPAVGRKQVAAPQQLVGDRRRRSGIEDHPHAVPARPPRPHASPQAAEFRAATRRNPPPRSRPPPGRRPPATNARWRPGPRRSNSRPPHRRRSAPRPTARLRRASHGARPTASAR